MLAEVYKVPGKLDCLKPTDVLALERLHYTSFHLCALIFLVCAVIHTLLVDKIHAYARIVETREAHRYPSAERSLFVQTLLFLSEVEVVFAIWAIPLFLTLAGYYGLSTALEYINTRDYTEALFVVVILSISSTRPILHFAEKIIRFLARGLGGSLSAWWFVLLTFGPLLGSFITEAGAMAITALLLSKQFYDHHPSNKLAYGTLGLLFTNISVGGVLTNFASPAVLILSHAWHWSNWDVFYTFGWKAVIGILLVNLAYWAYFRRELYELNLHKKPTPDHNGDHPPPVWIILAHLFFLALIVMTSEYPAIFFATFLFFLGFHQGTRHHQHSLQLVRPLLVGLFLAGLVILGGLQGWWVLQILQDLSPKEVLGVALGLTAFNDNAAIAYLSILIPDLTPAFKYALFTAVIAGGGLTVIANAPNPAGYVMLAKHFGGSISAWRLFLAAFPCTMIFYAVFSLLSM
ncbi:MAG: hypothetical protein KGJ02_01615 [Verrucomicrobiota bacterium]|nr:hypothetical protein [Verrucomicrobiota bacterium]